MPDLHPNVALLMRFDPSNPAVFADVFASDAKFRYFNPNLPGFEGVYEGPAGIGEFFQKLESLTGTSFSIAPVSVAPFGEELVVAHTKNHLVLNGQRIVTDVVTVWRIVDGRIQEIWDIPSAHAGVVTTQA